ncbi:MAG TPA: hypothetical protein VGY55_14085 [Pirellulales bacterium]|jgi:hypothetical protein|nr:hypothetical protein [Pirellulales bacterium]
MNRQAIGGRSNAALSVLLVAAIVAASLGRRALAVTYNWNAGDGNWSVPGNWSPAGVPAGGDTANVLNTDGVSRTITYDYTGPGLTLAFLSVDLTGGMPTDTETFSMAANNLTSAFEYVGWSAGNGSGTFNQSGGVNKINGTALYLGLNPTDNGYYNLSGTGSLLASGNTGEVVGYSGTGTFTQNGGTNSFTSTNGQLYLGFNASSSGTYVMNSGILSMNTTTGEEIIGWGSNSTAIFTQSGGTNSTSLVIVSQGSGSSGTYNLHGGTLTAGLELVGSHGTGTFNQDGGANNPSQLSVGSEAFTSAGAYNLSGGTLNCGALFVGYYSGPGTFTQTGGVVNVLGSLGIGPAPGAYNLSGGIVNIAGGLYLIGNPALFNWTAGTVNFTTDVTFDSNGTAGPTTGNAFGAALSLGAGQTLMVTGNETLGGVGPFSLTLGAGGAHYVTGTLTLSPTGTIEQDAGSTLYAAMFTQAGGTVNGTLQNQGVFNYQSGAFNGKLRNQGTVSLGPNFTAASGIENDTSMTVAAGQIVTANGDGLDNLGLLTFNGGTVAGTGPLVNEFGGTIQGRGTVASPLANFGTLSASGVMALSGGITNDGLVQGNGNITGAFANNADGAISVAAGNSLSITGAWTNNGVIALSDGTARLGGGAIANHSALQGLGIVNSAVANTGTIEALGGTLSFGGALTNPAGGMLTAGSGAKLLVTGGLATNAGIVNLTGGTFDNNGHPLNNTGQISGWGIFRTGGTGLDNNGSITFSGGVTTVNGPVTDENGKTIVVAYNPAIFTGLVTNNGGGTFNIVSTTAVFAGGSSGTFGGTFTNNANSAFSEGGSGALEVDGVPTLNTASSLAVNDSSTLRFKATSGVATIGAGVAATVNNGATLELAGSESALSNGPNRVNITNRSTAPAGILVSGTHQQVGNIDGSGTTQVDAGSDLAANHIVQSALAIGGTSGSPALVTIDASDANGNPLDEPSGFALADSLTPSGPFGAGVISSANLSSIAADSTDLAVPAASNSVGTGNASQVPEPSTLLLALIAVLGVISTQFVRRHFQCQTV